MDFNKLKKSDLQMLLTDRDIKYKSNAKKAELLDLLLNQDMETESESEEEEEIKEVLEEVEKDFKKMVLEKEKVKYEPVTTNVWIKGVLNVVKHPYKIKKV